MDARAASVRRDIEEVAGGRGWGRPGQVEGPPGKVLSIPATPLPGLRLVPGSGCTDLSKHACLSLPNK